MRHNNTSHDMTWHVASIRVASRPVGSDRISYTRLRPRRIHHVGPAEEHCNLPLGLGWCRITWHTVQRARQEPISEVHKSGHRTTGHSVEPWEFLAGRAYAMSSYALACAALTISRRPSESHLEPVIIIRRRKRRRRVIAIIISICVYVFKLY